jgi:hypothetical protein
MIQPLRVVHRRAFLALALVLPAILVVGLGSRHSHPGLRVVALQVPISAHLVRTSDGAWPKHSIRTELYSDWDRPQGILVVLQPAQELNEPDLLLYWTHDAPRGNALRGEAVLVGAFSTGKAFLLPLNEQHAGHLVLFSPAHQAVYDTARVEKLP